MTPDALVHAVFLVMLAATGVLYALAHVAPQTLVGFISVPWVFQWRRNLGQRAFELQTALYAVFHRNLFDDVCHHFLVIDQLAWLVLAHAVAGVPGLVVVTLLAVLQSLTFRERGLTTILAVVWVVLVAAAWGLVGLLGESGVMTAEVALLASALLRAIGHAGEPLPPLVGDDSLQFSPVRVRPRLVLVGAVGWVAEFASGVPFRLFASQVHLMAQRFGFEPKHAPSLAEMEDAARVMGTKGWGGHELTREFFAEHAAATQPAA